MIINIGHKEINNRLMISFFYAQLAVLAILGVMIIRTNELTFSSKDVLILAIFFVYPFEMFLDKKRNEKEIKEFLKVRQNIKEEYGELIAEEDAEIINRIYMFRKYFWIELNILIFSILLLFLLTILIQISKPLAIISGCMLLMNIIILEVIDAKVRKNRLE
jgi:hypothetical protein